MSRNISIKSYFNKVVLFYFYFKGIYANDLAGRLISNKSFADSVRMHSRTVFKISSTGLLFLISLALMCVNSYHSWINFQTESCQQIGVTNALCLIAFSCKVGFGVFALIWNCMVGFILLSVCRTHTIGKYYIYVFLKIFL